MNRSIDDAASYVLDASAMRLPLESGLLAAAEQCEPRTASKLREVAYRVRAGEDVATALADQQSADSRFALAAVRAGIASDEFGQVLVELTEFAQRRRAVLRGIGTSLAYPLGLLLFSIVILTLSLVYGMPFVSDMNNLEQSVYGYSQIAQNPDGVIKTVVLSVATFGVFLVGVRLILGRVRWRWLLTTVPVVGSILSLLAVWEFADKLRMLVARQVPLGESLDIVASEMADANVADVSRILAARHRSGEQVGFMLMESTRIPATLGTVIAWGEANDRLGESLAMAADIFRGRLILYVDLILGILPPVVYVAVAAITLIAASILIASLGTMAAQLGTLI